MYLWLLRIIIYPISDPDNVNIGDTIKIHYSSFTINEGRIGTVKNILSRIEIFLHASADYEACTGLKLFKNDIFTYF